MKKIRNYKCTNFNCDECPLRMLECKGFLYSNKSIGQVWKEYIAVHTASIKEDKIFVNFINKRMEVEK